MKDANTEKTLGEGIFDKARRGSKSALRELKNLADNEDAEALSKLAEIYLKGLGGVEQSPQKTIELLNQAAAQDYVPALYRLGKFYYYGQGGLTSDARKAVEYLTRAAELGELKSYELLGEIYFSSEGGVEADGYKAIDYLLKYAAAMQRQITNTEDSFLEAVNAAFKIVADLYLYGKCGVTQDGYKAIENFAKAEDWFNSACIYRDGKAGVVQDAGKAIEYFTRIEAWSEIATIYEEGCGEILPNREKAIEFYAKCSQQMDIDRLTKAKDNLQELINLADDRDASALCELAEVHFKGLGGAEQSLQKATELLNQAAAHGYPPALYRLGEFYLYGKCGVTQNGYKALELFNQAAELDDEYKPDYKLLTCTYREGVGGIKQSGQKVLEHLIKDYGEDTADDVVDIYWHGCGEIKPDGRKAFEYTCAHGLRNVLSNCYVLDEKLGDIRRDGQKVLDTYNRRLNRLQELKAPDLIIANELMYISEIYEEGYGGLAPNREKAIEFYKQCVALLPRDKRFKDKLDYLTDTSCQ